MGAGALFVVALVQGTREGEGNREPKRETAELHADSGMSPPHHLGCIWVADWPHCNVTLTFMKSLRKGANSSHTAASGKDRQS